MPYYEYPPYSKLYFKSCEELGCKISLAVPQKRFSHQNKSAVKC